MADLPRGMAMLAKSVLGIDPDEIAKVAATLAATAAELDARVRRMELMINEIYHRVVVTGDGPIIPLRTPGSHTGASGGNGAAPAIGGAANLHAVAPDRGAGK